MAISSCTGAVERTYQIPPFHEIVDKAMFVYDRRSPIQGATSQIRPASAQLLFPFMNFTCSGNITRLVFVPSELRDSSDGVIIQKPVFSLWNRDGNNMYYSKTQSSFNQLISNQPINVLEDGLVEVNFTPYVRFEVGDILGLRQQNGLSNLRRLLNVRVLRQRGGYGLILNCTAIGFRCPVSVGELQQIPYIAIETMTCKIIVYVLMPWIDCIH